MITWYYIVLSGSAPLHLVLLCTTRYYLVLHTSLARFLNEAISVPKIKHKKVTKTLDKSQYVPYLRYSWSMVANEPRESNMDNQEYTFADWLAYQEKRSIIKECEGCKQEVLLPSEYGYCDTCADARERGTDL